MINRTPIKWGRGRASKGRGRGPYDSSSDMDLHYIYTSMHRRYAKPPKKG